MDRPMTKLVCTIGPASAARIPELVAAGMDVARINFSHGNLEEHRDYVHAVRAAAHAARRSVAVMVDLPGPKIRLGELDGGRQRLEPGADFVLMAAADGPGTAAAAATSSTELAGLLQVGDRVYLADGAVELRVTAIEGADVHTAVVHGGVVRTRTGVNLPSERMTTEGLTDEDRAAVAQALELRADLLAQSFVRSAADVAALRALLPADGPRVVAKIETRVAVEDFDAIADAADGIMIARGDLGVDVPFEDVPLIQKDLIERAIARERFTIVATQMLESMTHAPRPTRAEASDVANAVLDGADSVMLSAETAIGEYPLEALQAMAGICLAAEREEPETDAGEAFESAQSAMVVAAVAVADAYPDAGAIWCFTRSGRTAELLSEVRPRIPIFAFTLSPVVARRLAVRHGVIPMILPANGRGEPLVRRMEHAWRGQRGAGQYQAIVLVTTSGQPDGINRLELHTLSDSGTRNAGSAD